jgi:multidrug efflux pump subunit AcrA (membrane-fusion protein)
MQKRIRANWSIPILAIALLSLVLAGCATHSAVAVTTAVAANQELSTTLDLNGVLVPADTANISSQIAGKVVSLGFQAGDTVKAGDVLMQLDTASLNAQLEQAQASLQSAEAAVVVARNQAAVAKISVNSAQESYNRVKALFDSGADSQSALDNATNALNTAQAQYDNASGAALDQANAAVDTAKANVNSIEVQLGETTITSPLNGVLSSRTVDVGEVVSAGVTVMSVVDSSSLKLTSTVTQDVLPLLALGQTMNVTVDSLSNRSYQGTITTLGPIAVSTGEVFPVEITIKNDGQLMGGMTAHASAAVKASGIVVPPSAVVQGGGVNYVFVIKDGVASKRLVTLGQKSDQGILILTGLTAGEQVAVTNTNALGDNVPVTVISGQ